MGAPHPTETKEAARALVESGRSFSEVSEEMGLPKQTLSTWAKSEKWSIPEQDRTSRVRTSISMTLDAVAQRLSGLPKAVREAEYDEKMHQIACSIPEIIAQMAPDEVLAKADKVAKLVAMSRDVLNRTESARPPAPSISVGLLTGSTLPTRIQLVDSQVVEQDMPTGLKPGSTPLPD